MIDLNDGRERLMTISCFCKSTGETLVLLKSISLGSLFVCVYNRPLKCIIKEMGIKIGVSYSKCLVDIMIDGIGWDNIFELISLLTLPSLYSGKETQFGEEAVCVEFQSEGNAHSN